MLLRFLNLKFKIVYKSFEESNFSYLFCLFCKIFEIFHWKNSLKIFKCLINQGLSDCFRKLKMIAIYEQSHMIKWFECCKKSSWFNICKTKLNFHINQAPLFFKIHYCKYKTDLMYHKINKYAATAHHLTAYNNHSVPEKNT